MTTTDSGGVYDVPQLTPGIYSIRFKSSSFKTSVQQNVLLQNGPITVNGFLQVGSATEQVVVDANATVQLQTEDSQQSLTIDAKTIEGLPNAASGAQGWFNETALIPGVSGGGGQATNGSGIGINGGESYQESFLLNGGTVTLIGSQNPDWIINPTDFIAENDFDTHTFNASSGNGAAIFNVITKSGTNRFHGSVYDYNVNSYFGARNYFSTTVPPLSSNLAGGTVGGPILKDRLFFFFGFQRLGSTTGSTLPQLCLCLDAEKAVASLKASIPSSIRLRPRRSGIRRKELLLPTTRSPQLNSTSRRSTSRSIFRSPTYRGLRTTTRILSRSTTSPIGTTVKSTTTSTRKTT